MIDRTDFIVSNVLQIEDLNTVINNDLLEHINEKYILKYVRNENINHSVNHKISRYIDGFDILFDRTGMK